MYTTAMTKEVSRFINSRENSDTFAKTMSEVMKKFGVKVFIDYILDNYAR